jgi:phage terminase small subunit
VSVSVSPLTPRRALFVREYLRDLNGKQSAIRAGYAPKHAQDEASRLLADPNVKAAVDAALAERFAEVKAEATLVVQHLLDVACADPNDLVQSRRGCCRFCWGKGFRYQRTAGELARDRASHEADQERKRAEADRDNAAFTPSAFSEQGGDGYHALREPNEDCPECFGDGVLDVHITDSRLLRGGARRLYAGVKRTKDGIEVKMRDQDKALEMLGRHLGLFNDRLELTGKVELANTIVAARRRTSTADEPGSDLA